MKVDVSLDDFNIFNINTDDNENAQTDATVDKK